MSTTSLTGAAPAERLRVEVFTIFPDLVAHYGAASILGRARDRGLLDLRVHDLRSAATDPHRSVDDSPFGGGPGMILAPEPVFGAVEAVEASGDGLARPLILLSPSGRTFDQRVAEELAALGAFSLLCGRYEGVDHRITEHLVDEELSVGDVVLAGGELGALLVLEATTRLVPGVLGNEYSPIADSFSTGLLEYPQYTRPAVFRGWEVPEVLRSGNHAEIARYELLQSLVVTLERRPDLIEARGGLSGDEVALVAGAGHVELLARRGYHS